MRCRGSLAAALVALAVIPAVSAAAQGVEKFYGGNTVTLLIGFGVGGGTDAWGRTVAAHIGSHIPGHPKVVPQYMPGAGGLKMTNYLYNAAPKDGSVFGLTNAGIPLEPLLKGKGVNFDPMKLNWIGSPDRDTTICVASKDAPVKTMNDLMTRELVVGASGSGGNTNIYPMFFANLIGMKFKIIKGYNGTREILLAVERGEVMGMCSDHDPLTQQPLFREGKLRILFQAAMTKDAQIDAPVPTPLITTDAQRKAMELFLARQDLGRPFVAPPRIVAERVQALRRAFDATMKDPGFLADAKKQKFNVVAVTGEILAATIAKIYQTAPDAVRLTAKALGRIEN
jgi:tripartite-type tricarboxylate transporter receptor subunit TctC